MSSGYFLRPIFELGFFSLRKVDSGTQENLYTLLHCNPLMLYAGADLRILVCTPNINDGRPNM